MGAVRMVTRLHDRVAEALQTKMLAPHVDASRLAEEYTDAVLAALAAHITEGLDEAQQAVSDALYERGDGIAPLEYAITESPRVTRAALTAFGLPTPEPGA